MFEKPSSKQEKQMPQLCTSSLRVTITTAWLKFKNLANESKSWAKWVELNSKSWAKLVDKIKELGKTSWIEIKELREASWQNQRAGQN